MKLGLLALGTVAASATVTVVVTRRAIRKRCTTVVVSGCKKVPLATDAFCRDQARSICVGGQR
jgi:hypothetical protein